MRVGLPVTGRPVLIPADDPVAVEATRVVQAGDLDALDRLLREQPELATARLGDPDCSRTLLLAAADWPGHFPNGPAVVRALVAAGADVGTRFVGGHTETPLHWAASSDDVAVLDALLDLGADIEADGAVLGGGTAMADACGFGNWAAARRLVERGARTRLKDAAALGLMDRVVAAFAEGAPPPSAEQVTWALWSACHGGRRAAAEYLIDRGADVDWVGWDDLTPLDVALKAADNPENPDGPAASEAADLVAWLRSRGARTAADQP